MSSKNRDHLKQQSVRALERALSEEYPGERTSYTRALRIFDSLGIEVMRRAPSPGVEGAMPVKGTATPSSQKNSSGGKLIPLKLNVIVADSQIDPYDPLQDALSLADNSGKSNKDLMLSMLMQFFAPEEEDNVDKVIADVRARTAATYILKEMDGYNLGSLLQALSVNSGFEQQARSLSAFRGANWHIVKEQQLSASPPGLRSDSLNLVLSETARDAMSTLKTEIAMVEKRANPAWACYEEAKLLRAAYGERFLDSTHAPAPLTLSDLSKQLDEIDDPRGMIAICSEDEWLLNYLEMNTKRWALRGGGLKLSELPLIGS